jgi:uroporphyrinogen decarboxylase
MNSKERILAALSHKESDHIPIDLGGTPVTSISLSAYAQLLRYLTMESLSPKLYMPFNQTVEVDSHVLDVLGGDTYSVYYGPKSWSLCQLEDGFVYQVPTRWIVQAAEDSKEVVLDDEGHVFAQRALGTDYFQRPYAPLAEATSIAAIDRCLHDIERVNVPFYLDESLSCFGERTRTTFASTNRMLIGNYQFSVFMAAQRLRGWENFMMDLIANQTFAEALMDRLVEAHMTWFTQFADVVGDCIQVVLVADDLGMQDRPQLSPELYRRVVKPYHKKLYQFIKENSDVYLLLHTDGAVADFIPDFLEMGIDALNPVQSSSRGMDPRRLKREFGKDLTFWGGGCDTQRTLPFGSPSEVRDEVKRSIDDLAPGGGFVFAQVHAIPAGTPPENVAAMYEAAREYGSY